MRRFGACARKARSIRVARTITASALGMAAAMVCSFTGSRTSTVTPGAPRIRASASGWTGRRQTTCGILIPLRIRAGAVSRHLDVREHLQQVAVRIAEEQRAVPEGL